MLDHVSITVTGIGAAEKFYDAVMSALGVPKGKSELRLGYSERCDADHPDRNFLSIKIGDQPEDTPARHWCLKAPSRAAVDAFWKAEMANGGTDNGPQPFATSTTQVTTLPSDRSEWKQGGGGLPFESRLTHLCRARLAPGHEEACRLTLRHDRSPSDTRSRCAT